MGWPSLVTLSLCGILIAVAIIAYLATEVRGRRLHYDAMMQYEFLRSYYLRYGTHFMEECRARRKSETPCSIEVGGSGRGEKPTTPPPEGRGAA